MFHTHFPGFKVTFYDPDLANTTTALTTTNGDIPMALTGHRQQQRFIFLTSNHIVRALYGDLKAFILHILLNKGDRLSPTPSALLRNFSQ
jgi:hypothetical protein